MFCTGLKHENRSGHIYVPHDDKDRPTVDVSRKRSVVSGQRKIVVVTRLNEGGKA